MYLLNVHIKYDFINYITDGRPITEKTTHLVPQNKKHNFIQISGTTNTFTFSNNVLHLHVCPTAHTTVHITNLIFSDIQINSLYIKNYMYKKYWMT